MALNTTSEPLRCKPSSLTQRGHFKGKCFKRKGKKRESQKEKEIEKNNTVVWSDVAKTTTDWRSRPDFVPVLPFTAV